MLSMLVQKLQSADLLTGIMLAVFRVNGRLLERGDALVKPIGLTSARWQVLGAIVKAEEAPTAPQIAESMGITRQGAQRQLNLLINEGFVKSARNPDHARSPRYCPTDSGRRALAAASEKHEAWVAELADGLSPEALEASLAQLNELYDRLRVSKRRSGLPQ